MYQTCNTCTEDNDSEGLHISNESSAVSCDYSGFDIVKATQYGALERVKELVEAGHDVSFGRFRIAQQASSNSHYYSQISSSFKVNQPDSETVYLLHWAAINNRLDIIKFLLERGAHVDAVGGELQASSLHWATRQGHLQAVVLLVKGETVANLLDSRSKFYNFFNFQPALILASKMPKDYRVFTLLHSSVTRPSLHTS